MRRPTPRPAAEGSAVRPCGRPRSWSSPDQIASPGAISSVPCWFAQYSVRQRYLLGTPGGGGVDHSESINDAARRELYEKTGIQIDDVGVCVAVVDGAFTFNGRDYRQREYVFSVRVQESFCRPVAFADEIERAAHLGHRWWDVDQVLATEHNLYPAALPELLTRPRKSL